MGTAPPASVFVGRQEGRFERIETPVLNTAVAPYDRLNKWESELYDMGYVVIPDALPAMAVEHFRERLVSFEPSAAVARAEPGVADLQHRRLPYVQYPYVASRSTQPD